MLAQQEERRRRYLIVAIVLILIGIVTLTLYLSKIPQLQWITNPFVPGVACFLIISGIILWIVGSHHIFHGNWIINPSTRQVIMPVGIALLIIGTFFGIAGTLWNLPAQITNVVSILLNSLGWLMALLSLPSSTNETHISPPETKPQSAFPIQQFQPAPASIQFRNLQGVPPPHDTKDIQPHLAFANDIYTTLTKSSTPVTAVAITGYSDELISMLAARICWEARRKRQADDSPFEADELWLSINHETTLRDIVGTLCQIQNMMIPNFASMTTQELANVFLDALNTP